MATWYNLVKILAKLKTSTSFSAAVITQTVIGFSIVVLLYVNLEWNNGVIDNWSPYLLIYLAYLIIISPVLSKVSSLPDKRKKFVTARDELIKAQKCATNNPEDVMIHIRTAIEL